MAIDMCDEPVRTRVKFCGFTRPDDVDVAVRLGTDALGFVLWPGSKRGIDQHTLPMLASRVPAFVTRVGLFVNPSREEVESCLPHLDLLQFHGDESPEFCAQFGSHWIKALRMKDDLDLYQAAEDYRDARGLLLDAYRPGVPGGTGETFDWSRIPSDLPKPVILAGGLSADNVAEAISRVRPFAVDVSGGIESAPGLKDAAAMRAFISAVKRMSGF
ncbi:phosphoribosylanthranilate isomerase [Halomonas binhaiensis]|uniref:N-(5'-phosphoribosyl)anthranilate isomerase n=1 Tax=Halomonas binhaiensis TaxID=2562282 RepID=A0A5C1NEF9_9GAMM|nr:phosphoribosylanthranilate isomerase [Halomonas binhaiensis]QEM81556.1 phosphoribosylanthranilate isomerase [Halomonas binhaiensis]